MPTLSSMKIPPPQSWEEFEELTLDSCKIKWENPDLQKHGRQGQAQNGVDIYGANHTFKNVGVQCKNYETPISLKMIKEEIEKAESFQPAIDMYYLASTTNIDASLQKDVRLLSQQRSAEGKFPVMVLFWNDIIQELTKKKDTFKKHYPELEIPTSVSDIKRSIKLHSILDMVYNAMNLDFYIELIFGDIGQLAGEDPLQIQSSLLTIKYSSSNVLAKEDYQKVSELIDEYANLLFPKSERREEFSWDKAKLISNEFIGIIDGAQYNLETTELAIYNIGITLTRWIKWETETDYLNWPMKSWNILSQLIKTLELEALDEEVRLLEIEYNQGDHWVKLKHPHKVYNTIRRHLTI